MATHQKPLAYRRSLSGLFRTCVMLLVVLPIGLMAQDRPQDSDQATVDGKDSLEAIQNMVIGQWRGVGQPRRGSSRGSWIESTTWSWKFAGEKASLVFTTDDAKFYTSGEITTGEKPETYVFTGITADGESEIFNGTRDEDGRLSFMATEAKAKRPARITLRTVADGDRLLMLMERQLTEDRFARLAEIGYTRQGSGFGQGATAGPECVVTGGLGTIEVQHDGKSYFVCCSGCQDLFNTDPERILAEYAKRKEEEKNKKKQ